jgi:RHS repeat-associated protein
LLDVLAAQGSQGGTLYFSDGTNLVAQTTFTVPADWGRYAIITGDWNGDGKTDIALIADGDTAHNHYKQPTPHQIWLSTGTGFEHISTADIPNSADAPVVVSGDWNSDGASDLWVQQESGDDEYLFYYKPEVITAVTNGLVMTNVSYDRLNKNAPFYTKCSTSGTYICTDTAYPTQVVDGPLYVVSEVDADNGLGVCVPSTRANCYSSLYTYQGAKTDLQGRGFLGFSQVTITDCLTGVIQQTAYRTDFPFIGSIASQTKTAPATPPTTSCQAGGGTPVVINSTVNTYDEQPLGTGTDNVKRVFAAVKTTTTTNNDRDFTTGTLYPMPTIQTTYTYDCDPDSVPATSCAGTAPTGFGDTTKVVVDTIFSGATTSEKTTTNTYTDDGTNWFLDRLTKSVVLSNVTGTPQPITRTSSFAYDPNTGLLKQEIVEPTDTGSMYLETDYGYDSFGNKTSVTTKGYNDTYGAARQTMSQYDTSGEFLVTLTNALSQSDTWGTQSAPAYDTGFGLPTTHKDANNQSTNFYYDTFGRLTEKDFPDGTKTMVQDTYLTGLPPGESGRAPATAAFDVIVTPERSSDHNSTQRDAITITYYDALSRAVAQDRQGFDGSWIRVETKYDGLGRVSQTSRPYFLATGTPQYTTSTYDVLGRVQQLTMPDSSHATYAYQGFTTSVTTDQNQITKTVKNTEGLVASVIDALDPNDPGNHTTSYSYDAVGDLLSVQDPKLNTVTNTYDIRGRKTASSDPDMGAWSYQYDAFGELVLQTDAKQAQTSLSYDLVGHLVQRVEPDLISNWVYGNNPANFNVGQLQKGCTRSNNTTGCSGTQVLSSRAVTYDSNARPHTVTLTVNGSAYVYTAAYDQTAGWLSSVTRPSGLVLDYVHDQTFGYLDETKDDATGTVYWQANTRDAELHLIQSTAANGLETVQSFDPKTGMLLGTCGDNDHTAPACDGKVANFLYHWDTVGRLTSRSDALTGGTPVTEHACYDMLNRLTETSLNGTDCTNGIKIKNMSYDAIGNFIQKSDISKANGYSYGVAAGPHAVTSINTCTGCTINGVANPHFTYDLNGNMLCELVNQGDPCNASAPRYVTWKSFNMAASVTEGSHTMGITYDESHARIIRAFGTGGELTTTLYLNAFGEMEEMAATGPTTAWTDYIQADSQIVAQRTGTSYSGGPLTFNYDYFVLDHLGSIAVVTDSTGAVTERDAYDPWGKRRDPTTWHDIAGCSAGSGYTTRGFTNQEELDSVCLVDLNARVYDPTIGRFMSADPTVEAMFDPQDLNRYSYVGNNPLSLTDPTGLCFLGCVWQDTWFRQAAAIVIAIALPQILPAVEDEVFGEQFAEQITTLENVGIAGGISGYVSTGTLQGALAGAEQAVVFNKVGDALEPGGAWDQAFSTSHTMNTLIAHGLVGGMFSVEQHGTFGSGFLAAGFATLADGVHTGSPLFGDTFVHAAVGGLSSVLGGGKFANGAITAAFGYRFNEDMHAQEWADQDQEDIEALHAAGWSYGQIARMQFASAGVGLLTGIGLGGVADWLFGTDVAEAIYFDAAQVQSKFGHAADFGVTGNYNQVNALKFVEAMSEHIDSAEAIQGTYRGTIPVTSYFNPSTDINVMVDQSGNYISGWKLSPAQVQNLLRSGNIQ